MTDRGEESIRDAVRERYAWAAIAVQRGGGDADVNVGEGFGSSLYDSQVGDLPPDAVAASLGCGNPTMLANLEEGQVVLDLGSGGGIDVLLSARRVGPSGKVYGLDMTPEMLALARRNQAEAGADNVEFLLGMIEDIPLADESVDVIISNCVINLCPDKRPVYQEAFRVLRPGGRLAVSDVVAREELSEDIKRDLTLHSGCLAGATLYTDLTRILEESGFTEIVIRPKGNSDAVITSWESKRGFETKVFAAEVTATKPGSDCCASTCCNEGL